MSKAAGKLERQEIDSAIKKWELGLTGSNNVTKEEIGQQVLSRGDEVTGQEKAIKRVKNKRVGLSAPL